MITSFEIRECRNCGLRYPLTQGHTFGNRCPSCLGETRVVLTRPLNPELEPSMNPAAVQLEALLDNIRSAWNVGSIFRTADGFGLKHLHLCGITPTPETEAVRKTSLGAEKTVRWSYHKNAVLAGRQLKSKGYKVLALEEDTRSIPIQNAQGIPVNEKIVLISGNEVTGVDPDLLDICDKIFFIPMSGNKKSFNVAVAFAVAVSRLVL